jgi:hypothetical protein
MMRKMCFFIPLAFLYLVGSVTMPYTESPRAKPHELGPPDLQTLPGRAGALLSLRQCRAGRFRSTTSGVGVTKTTLRLKQSYRGTIGTVGREETPQKMHLIDTGEAG